VWAALVLVGLAAALVGDAPREAVHVLIRKPIFLYLAWGVGVATAVALAPRGILTAALGVACAGALAVTVGASFVRIARGDALWVAAIDHLTRAIAIDDRFRDLTGHERDFDAIRSDPRFVAATSVTV
jgi:hypothetical protein